LDDSNEPLRAEGLATLIAIRLTPRGGRDALEPARQLADSRSVLSARVRAVPENGEANRALIELVSKTLGCPVRAVQLVSGATSRLKTVRVEWAYQDVKNRLLRLGLL
jgi:uncharacterized protein YggU (UPF0235/DUF167 family)